MFAKTIIDSDAFLDMPLTAQALYFHLSMRADDEGFLNNANKIMRMIGANQNDFDMLHMKRFIIKFDDGICVIKHWRVHNYIQSDRFKPTIYQEERSMLGIKDNKSYTLQLENSMDKECIHDVSSLETQDRLGKVRLELGKDSIEKDNRVDYQLVVDMYNNTCVSFPRLKTLSDKRKKAIKARSKTYSLEQFQELFTKAEQSNFLKGGYNRNWSATFDWLLSDANMAKVLDGNYDNKNEQSQVPKQSSNKFNNFQQRKYSKEDFRKMEQLLLNKG